MKTTIVILTTILIALSFGCDDSSPVDPVRNIDGYGSRADDYDGTQMGCRSLAVYFAAHYVKDEFPDAPDDLRCDIYRLHYEAYRSAITDNTDHCDCIVRQMVQAKEEAGNDVPEWCDIDPTC